jgi:Extensin-like protein C-terminus
MTRGVALWLAGFLALVTLAGCGRSWFETRDPWRHEAEIECLKTGAVRQGPGIVQITPIQGPGVCGADFPLRVSALGASAALGFGDELRPPALIPQYSPAPPPYPYNPPPRPGAADVGAPMPISPREGEPLNSYPPGPPTYGTPATSYPEPLSVRAPGGTPYPGPPDERFAHPPDGSAPSPPGVSPPQFGTQPPDERRPGEIIRLGSSPGPVSATSEGAAVVPAATLACPLVASLESWIAAAAQPAAQRWFGQPVVEIKQISAYSCRSMNGQRGMPISEHAFGNALDIAAFTLADGRRVSVRDGWRGAPEERGFLHEVHAAACQRFATVLAPGSNAFHYDHIHVDLARRASGRVVCNPRPMPGELVAQREMITGSIHSNRRLPLAPSAHERDGRAQFDGYLPRAVPGED